MKYPWNVIAWWEVRRIPYNLLLAILGIASILSIEFVGSHFVKPGEDVEEPIGILIGVVGYGVGANTLYTLGWITELFWCWGENKRTLERRQRIFRSGMIFSAILTICPAVLVPIGWVILGAQQ